MLKNEQLSKVQIVAEKVKLKNYMSNWLWFCYSVSRCDSIYHCWGGD